MFSNHKWERERLALLTQISDLQAMIVKLQEDAARERSEILDRFTAILSPSAMQKLRDPQAGHPHSLPARMAAATASYLPGTRPNLRPTETSVSLWPKDKLSEAKEGLAVPNATASSTLSSPSIEQIKTTST